MLSFVEFTLDSSMSDAIEARITLRSDVEVDVSTLCAISFRSSSISKYYQERLGIQP